jgi:hypothetical protein
MRKTSYILSATVLLVIILGAACSSAPQPTSAPSIPQSVADTPIPQATTAPNIPPPSTGSGSLAPVCQDTVSCQAPAVEQHEIACVKKVPYTNVSVPPGTTYEVLDKSGGFSCVDSGMVVNGKEVLTCHGTELLSFDLKLTNSSCSGASLATGTGQCQQGYGYDAAQNCCAPVTGDSGGSTTVRVDLGACPLPNQP